MSTAKKPGRVRLTCKCNKTFSTHSSNRTQCHTCKPKCRDRHYFGKRSSDAAGECK